MFELFIDAFANFLGDVLFAILILGISYFCLKKIIRVSIIIKDDKAVKPIWKEIAKKYVYQFPLIVKNHSRFFSFNQPIYWHLYIHFPRTDPDFQVIINGASIPYSDIESRVYHYLGELVPPVYPKRGLILALIRIDSDKVLATEDLIVQWQVSTQLGIYPVEGKLAPLEINIENNNI